VVALRARSCLQALLPRGKGTTLPEAPCQPCNGFFTGVKILGFINGIFIYTKDFTLSESLIAVLQGAAGD
jgi:hypothetical protein